MSRRSFLTILFFSFPLLACGLGAAASHYEKYFAFISSHRHSTDHIGSYKKGEIEIVQDKKMIMEIEEMQKALLIRKGVSKEAAAEASKIGIISEDQYWIWVRDGVIFPTGAKGTYNRIIWKRGMTDAVPRVAMLPVLPNGNVVLNLSYRHALRKWVLEIPRGFKRKSESNNATLKRQLREETGYDLVHSQHLGDVSPDSGLLSSCVPVYLVKLGKKRSPNQDFSEAILRIEEFTLEEVKKAISNGIVELEINGKKEGVTICDSYLAYAILQAETKNLFVKSSKP